ncbi:hypothetical protein AAVH_41171 [Aphelenchoides avenae]|nr:hypothetical protein AAVH_41171 [Aphelenchus avenae]
MSRLLFVLTAIAIVAFVVDAVNQGMPQGPHHTAPGKREAGVAPAKREASFASEGEIRKPNLATQDRGPQGPPRP